MMIAIFELVEVFIILFQYGLLNLATSRFGLPSKKLSRESHLVFVPNIDSFGSQSEQVEFQQGMRDLGSLSSAIYRHPPCWNSADLIYPLLVFMNVYHR